jgi:hypothetical protein
MRNRAVVLLSAIVVSASLFAQSAGDLQKMLEAEAAKIRAWGSDPVLVAAVKAQNAKRVPLAQIKSLDEQWKAGNAAALVEKVTSGPCADRLRALVGETYGETFVMDDQGALVCATAKTSDYWQGDEAKWQRAFDSGKGAVFIDRPKLDESSAERLAQISVPVVEDGVVIGTITAGVTMR